MDLYDLFQRTAGLDKRDYLLELEIAKELKRRGMVIPSNSLPDINFASSIQKKGEEILNRLYPPIKFYFQWSAVKSSIVIPCPVTFKEGIDGDFHVRPSELKDMSFMLNDRDYFTYIFVIHRLMRSRKLGHTHTIKISLYDYTDPYCNVYVKTFDDAPYTTGSHSEKKFLKTEYFMEKFESFIVNIFEEPNNFFNF